MPSGSSSGRPSTSTASSPRRWPRRIDARAVAPGRRRGGALLRRLRFPGGGGRPVGELPPALTPVRPFPPQSRGAGPGGLLPGGRRGPLLHAAAARRGGAGRPATAWMPADRSRRAATLEARIRAHPERQPPGGGPRTAPACRRAGRRVRLAGAQRPASGIRRRVLRASPARPAPTGCPGARPRQSAQRRRDAARVASAAGEKNEARRARAAGAARLRTASAAAAAQSRRAPAESDDALRRSARRTRRRRWKPRRPSIASRPRRHARR